MCSTNHSREICFQFHTYINIHLGFSFYISVKQKLIENFPTQTYHIYTVLCSKGRKMWFMIFYGHHVWWRLHLQCILFSSHLITVYIFIIIFISNVYCFCVSYMSWPIIVTSLFIYFFSYLLRRLQVQNCNHPRDFPEIEGKSYC